MEDSERFARVALMADSDQETVVRSGTDDDGDEVRPTMVDMRQQWMQS
jgi:hypothetical protein